MPALLAFPDTTTICVFHQSAPFKGGFLDIPLKHDEDDKLAFHMNPEIPLARPAQFLLKTEIKILLHTRRNNTWALPSDLKEMQAASTSRNDQSLCNSLYSQQIFMKRHRLTRR